jgi:hypothetical protein
MPRLCELYPGTTSLSNHAETEQTGLFIPDTLINVSYGYSWLLVYVTQCLKLDAVNLHYKNVVQMKGSKIYIFRNRK